MSQTQSPVAELPPAEIPATSSSSPVDNGENQTPVPSVPSRSLSQQTNGNNNPNERTSSSVPIQPVTVFNEPPPPPPPQHPDYLGDLFQDAVASASLPAPFEGWTDLLSLPDSVLLSRLGGEGTSTSSGSVSSLLNAGNLPGEVLTHPSRVLLRVLHRLSAEFRFLQMRQIDESDMKISQKKESQNAMIEQMGLDNIAKIKALLGQSSKALASGSQKQSSSSGSGGGGYDEMLAQNAITSLEKRLFSQQQKTTLRTRTSMPLTAAGSYQGSRPQINENQRLKTYWRARYQQACVELEEVEQEIALSSQDLFEVDKVIGCNTNEQLKDMIERCRVAEENAHAFAENCRMEMKRAELAAGRSNSDMTPGNTNTADGYRSGSRPNGGINNPANQQSPTSASPAGMNNDSFTPIVNPSFVGSSEHTSAGANLKEHELALLPFLVDTLSQHSPQAVQNAVSIRLKTQELQQLVSDYDQARERCEVLEQAIETAHNDYSAAVGRLPSHVSSNFEQVIKSCSQLEMAEDALFDAQASITAERMQFTKQRHDGTLSIEKQKCTLMEQKDKLRRDLRSAHLDLLRVERRKKDQPSRPVTAKDFTSIQNTMNPKSNTSLLDGASFNNNNQGVSNMSFSSSNMGMGNASGNNNNKDTNVADAASHLETMRARVKIYELERQSLLLDAMRSGAVPGPQ